MSSKLFQIIKWILIIGFLVFILSALIFTWFTMSGNTNDDNPKPKPQIDWMGRTNSVKSNERVYEIEVLDLKTGDTIVLHYTQNSARYTKAYKKNK
jgi:hypothetical protein